MVISIDGPAGSGKSTVAEILSKKLGFIHFNSGSLFRAVTVYLKHINYDFDKISPDCKMQNFDIKFDYKGDKMIVFVNKYNCTDHLRDNDISILSAKVSVNKHIRAIIDHCQLNFAIDHNLVIDGRDIGSHVFPNAEYKFYLDCSLEERAKRRLKEEQLKNNNVDLNQIIKEIAERDEIDKHKKYAPLVVPKGAIIIDSSALTIDQVVNEMLKHIKI